MSWLKYRLRNVYFRVTIIISIYSLIISSFIVFQLLSEPQHTTILLTPTDRFNFEDSYKKNISTSISEIENIFSMYSISIYKETLKNKKEFESEHYKNDYRTVKEYYEINFKELNISQKKIEAHITQSLQRQKKYLTSIDPQSSEFLFESITIIEENLFLNKLSQKLKNEKKKHFYKQILMEFIPESTKVLQQILEKYYFLVTTHDGIISTPSQKLFKNEIEQIKILLENEKAVIEYLAENGDVKMDLSVTSIPDKALVSYKRIGDRDWEVSQERTNCVLRLLPVKWKIKYLFPDGTDTIIDFSPNKKRIQKCHLDIN